MRYLISIIVFGSLILTSSCTIHFKAKELELEGQPNLTYELESVDLLKGG